MRPLLALLFRSLREDIRARSTYIARAGLVALMLFFLWQTHEEHRWAGAPGRLFFTSVLWVDLFILSVVGLSYFASAIAEEKEADALGLLRMTDLNALSILLGKSTSRTLGALLMIAAQLPFMLVAVTMGGLDVRQVFAGFLLLLTFAFHLANLALIGSVVCSRTSRATGLTAVLLSAFAFAPDLLQLKKYASSNFGTPVAEVFRIWMEATPHHRLQTITATGFNESPFGWHFIVNIGLGLVWFGVAWAQFERCSQSAGETAATDASEPSSTPDASRHGRPGKHPLRWKDYHFTAGGAAAAIVKLALALLVIGFVVAENVSRNRQRVVEEVAVIVFGVTGAVLAISLAFDAGRIFKSERQDQTLGSLALLPCTISRLAYEKFRGCLATNGPLFAMLAISFTILGYHLFPELVRNLRSYPRGTYFGTGVAVCFVVSALLLPVSVAWMSLRVPWGGLPLGFTAWFIGNQVAVGLSVTMFRDGSVFVLPVAGIVVGGILLKNMLLRLEKLAGGE